MKRRQVAAVLMLLVLVTLMLVTPAGAASAATSWPIVRTGSTGMDVRTVQHLLREQNADRSGVGDTGVLRVDGTFGTSTRRAVKQFQKFKGLTVDGIVGPETWRALVRAVHRGDRGEDVYALQEQLRHNAYAVALDGRFGAATQRAVRQAQGDSHLPIDGIARRGTWRALVGTSGD